MKYYLKLNQEKFYDGHSTPEDGQLTITPVKSEEAEKFTPNEWYTVCYNDEDEEVTTLVDELDDEFEENLHAQDGYHCTADYFKYIEVSKEVLDQVEQANKLFNRIKDGND